MAEQFDVELVAVIAEGLADEAGRGDALRSEPDNGEPAETRLAFSLAAQRVLGCARRRGLELARGVR